MQDGQRVTVAMGEISRQSLMEHGLIVENKAGVDLIIGAEQDTAHVIITLERTKGCRTKEMMELRESFTRRLEQAQNLAKNCEAMPEFWDGTVSALQTCLAKLDAMEKEIRGD